MTAFKQQLRKAVISASGALANLLVVLIRNKLLAITLGPAGIGWLALVNNLIETAAIVSSSGSSDALNRELARKKPAYSGPEVISTCTGLTALLCLLVIPAAVLVYYWLVPQTLGLALATAGLGFAILAASLWRFFAGVFLGMGLAGKMARAMVQGSIANLLLTAVLLWWGVREPIVFVILSPTMLAISGALVIGKHVASEIAWPSVRSLPALAPVLAIALPITIGLLLEPLIAFYLRSVTISAMGPEEVGLIQPGLQLALLMSVLFNSVAGITIVRWDQLHERAWSWNYRKLLAIAVLLPIVFAMAAWVFMPLYPFIVEAFFAKEFLPGTQTVVWFLIGESFRIGGALLLFTFMSRQLGYYTLLPRIGGLVTAIVWVQMSEAINIVAIAQAYTAAFGCYFVLALGSWLALQIRLDRPAET